MGAQVGGDADHRRHRRRRDRPRLHRPRHARMGSKTKIANAEIIGNEMVIGEVRDRRRRLQSAPPARSAYDVTIGRLMPSSPTSPRSRPARSSARPRSGTARRTQGRHGRRRARCRTPPRRRRRAARRSTSAMRRCSLVDPAGQPAADLPGLLHLRPDRRAALRASLEVRYLLVPAGARLADGDAHDRRDRRLLIALDALAGAARGPQRAPTRSSAASTCASGSSRSRPR